MFYLIYLKLWGGIGSNFMQKTVNVGWCFMVFLLEIYDFGFEIVRI